MQRLFLLALILLAPSAAGLPRERAQALLDAARELLGVPYDFGGHLEEGRGIDCQGVLFYAAERIGRCGWRSYSVFPTKTVAHGELGRPVEGLAPVKTDDLDLSRLEPGDVLWFVGFAENPKEPAIGALDGRPVWVWHTGLYAGEGRFVVGDHFAGAVVKEALVPYLERHRDVYAGVLVTRMEEGPKPKRCRRHAPMRRPQQRRSHQPDGQAPGSQSPLSTQTLSQTYSPFAS